MSNTRKVTLIVFAAVLVLAASGAASTKGSLTISLPQSAMVGGTQIEPCDLHVSWVSDSPLAQVTFSRNGKLIKEVQARFVERDSKAEANMLVLGKDDSGREVLKEIRLRGKKQVLTFE